MVAAGARARVRAEITREITEAARRQLAAGGAATLSLRAVARELGMVSSAVYRYYPSRDELLTTLIIEAYDALGAAAEGADDPAADLRSRWRAVCAATRAWALAHPHEYALVYGSPVPGYAAPRSTVQPAARVGALLGRIVADGVAAGVVEPGSGSEPDGSAATLAPGLAAQLGLPPGATGSALAARAVLAWTSLFGLISFELFGHTHNVVADHERYFAHAVDRLASQLGLPP